MAKLLKRRGLTFCTEHYVDQHVIDLIIPILVDQVGSGNFSEAKIRNLQHVREVSVWADPRGLAFYVGHGSMPVPVPWCELNVSLEDRAKIMMEMNRVFDEQYQRTQKIPNSFKIICNDTKIQLLLDMLEL